MGQSTETAIDQRVERYTEAVLKHFGHDRAGRSEAAVRQARGIAVAVSVARDEELEQLRYERRLLGAARMVLDLVADGDPARWEHARREAGDIAQRIVDEIGHPVTDEPALGPSYRAAIERVRALHRPEDRGAGIVCMGCTNEVSFVLYDRCKTQAALDA